MVLPAVISGFIFLLLSVPGTVRAVYLHLHSSHLEQISFFFSFSFLFDFPCSVLHVTYRLFIPIFLQLHLLCVCVLNSALFISA